MKQNTLLELKNISKKYDNKEVLENINLSITNGEFVTILGPSGCGKTTILRIVGGFESPDHGKIILNNQEITHLHANQRSTNTVFQNYALFPHLSVFENIAFGLKIKKLPKAAISQKVQEVLELVQLATYAHKMPHELSGGQQQRIAIARAIVNEPKLLLLDESLSALDYKLRQAMQIELKQIQRKLGITFLFVTHDQEEALSMSDTIIVMNHGIIEQIGTPKEIYENPKNLFVANFIGQTNILDGQKQGNNHYIIEEQKGVFLSFDEKIQNENFKILLRPEDLRVEKNPEDIKSSFYFCTTLTQVIYKGVTIDLVLELPNKKTILASEFYNEDSDALEYTIGQKLYFYWNEGWESIFENQ